MRIFKTLVVLVIALTCVRSYAQETRGTWMARNSFTSKANIARQMDSLAQNNFNVVYVNVWSRGYPLFPSNIFNAQTGVSIDPNYEGRDVLAECIAEGHRVGLQVYAWFEYGFVTGWTGNVPAGSKGLILDAHPDWVATQQNGTQLDVNNFYWMIQSKPECQNFLIAMGKEVLQKYDVDGIEMDRIRYSSLNYGYDSYTQSLFQAANAQALTLMATPSNPTWKQFRANNLNQFVSRMYDTLKAVNVKAKITNAPSQYSSSSYTSYDNFCQDWKTWINNGKVDGLEMQIYVTDVTTFGSYATYVKQSTNQYKKINPSFAVHAGTTWLTNAQLLQFIDKMRTLNLKGTAIWFADDLESRMKYIKTNKFASFNYPYGSTLNWRKWYAVTPVSNYTNALKTGTWSSSTVPGYNGGTSLYADSIGTKYIEYYATVPQTAWYEVYAYVVTGSNRNAQAEYTVYNSANATTVKLIDQTIPTNNGWVKLGDFQLASGSRKILKLSNANLSANRYVSADGMMIVLNRRLSPTVSPRIENDVQDNMVLDATMYPNPVSSLLNIKVSGESKNIEVMIYDVTGKLLKSHTFTEPSEFVTMDMSGLHSGFYTVRVCADNQFYVRKIVKQ